MRPDHLLSQIYPIHNAAVKTENIKIHPAGTGCDNQGIDAFFANVFFKHRNAFLAAQKRMGLGRFASFSTGTLHSASMSRESPIPQPVQIYTPYFLSMVNLLPPHQGLNRFKGHTGRILVG